MLFEVETDKAEKLQAEQPARPSRQRPVFLGHDWFEEIVRMSVEYVGDHMSVVVVDEEVAQLYPERVEMLYDQLPRMRVFKLRGGEGAKTFARFLELQNFLLKNEFSRDDTLISIGGGTFSDLVGFVAATYARGVSWLSIPTTFISQFDCAIGGKTAINLKNNKNYSGLFYWPNAVFVDTLFLETLPERYYRAGYSEMVRLALIADEPLFRRLCEATSNERGFAGIQEQNLEFIRDAMQVKLKLTASDPFQLGLRLVLLTGHTTAHALESASKMHLHHGEAVAIGLAFESFIAEDLKLIEPADRKALVDTLEACQLPTVLPAELHDRQLVEHMRLEKRNRGRLISLVLPYAPGRAAEDWPQPRLLTPPDELWSKLVAYRLACG